MPKDFSIESPKPEEAKNSNHCNRKVIDLFLHKKYSRTIPSVFTYRSHNGAQYHYLEAAEQGSIKEAIYHSKNLEITLDIVR